MSSSSKFPIGITEGKKQRSCRDNIWRDIGWKCSRIDVKT